MPISVKILIITCALILGGCAATVERTSQSESPIVVSKGSGKALIMVIQGSDVASKSGDWEKFREEWRSAMKEASAESGFGFFYQEANAESQLKNGTLVLVKVNDYRYVSQFARLMGGVAIGNAFVDADVSFFDMPSKTPIGARTYKTSSSAGQGIFSAMTAKQIRGISDEIVREIAQK
ncbi:MAG: DUF4410 domain-containing protein [Rhodocyclales bacterium]|nr:DUF4410 domain-containing protein [Rhodocyclales bacterium]